MNSFLPFEIIFPTILIDILTLFDYTHKRMPVTKTAKRALRSSKRKEASNKVLVSRLEIALRKAKVSPTLKNVSAAISLIDIAAKNNIFHKNKAARIKSRISKLIKSTPKRASVKKRK